MSLHVDGPLEKEDASWEIKAKMMVENALNAIVIARCMSIIVTKEREHYSLHRKGIENESYYFFL